MNKTVAIIFSKNRSLQCDLLLRSLYNCIDDFSELDIKIIYKVSDDRHKKSYKTLQSEWKNIQYIEESEFKIDVINAINGYDYTLFLTDDSIFVNRFNLDEITKLLDKNNSILGFSLRLGKNTGYCFSCNMFQDIPDMKEYNKDISIYFWPRSQFDFSYCLEVSSSIYRSKDILQVIQERMFTNPNQLEDALYANLWQFVCFKFRMACYNQSVAFANPLNQSTATNKTNRTGNDEDFSTGKLLELYEKGGRIESGMFYGLRTNAAHQLVKLF
jgi:hypothetical protein